MTPPPMTGALVRLEGLSVAFPDRSRKPLFGRAPMVEVVHGVDLEIPRGAALGLVGESGSGKTTIGRALVRLVKPSGGALVYDGVDIAGWDEDRLHPLRARLQMIFQDPQSSLNPRLTIGTTLQRPLEAFGRGGDRAGRRRRVAELLETVGLPAAFAGRYPHELSGGQRQRIGIARALALEPEFIVADEIVSGLDVSSQAQILLLLRRLQAELNLTLVFISHDLSVVRVLCDRVAVLSAGRVVEAGETAAVFADPKHAYTRELLTSVPLPEIEDGWIMAEVPAGCAGSAAAEGEVGRPAAFANRLGLVARARPAGIGLPPVVGLLRRPGEIGAGREMAERPVDVAVDVTGHAQQPAGGEDAGDAREILRADEAALPVPTLRPRVGIEQVDAGERGRGQPVEQPGGVIVMQADIAEGAVGDRRDRLGHAGDEGLDADEAGAGVGRGVGGQMVAPAEADLEPDVIDRRGEQRRQRGRRRRGEVDGEGRVGVGHEAAAAGGKGLALPPAVEPPSLLAVHAQTQRRALRSVSARSVFSHEKPPSSSAGRPKWP